MNHIYRLVWNRSINALVAVAENAKGRGKSGGKASKIGAVATAALLATATANAFAIGADTLPTGAQVTAGAASISSTANALTVQQTTQRTAINWQNFSVGSNATVNFQQPNASAVILNRVVGNESSVIAGALNANGQVFLLNSNGVLFTNGSSVNTGGLVASTLNISDADFMAGRNTFSANGSKASVINFGTINAAEGSYVALLGNQVKNEGVITAKLGAAVLAAGDQISLNFNGNSLVGVTVNQASLDALVENKQAIYADGGQVILTAKAVNNLLANVVNNTGEIRAQTIANQGGKIYLLGEGGTVNVDGTLDASAPNGGNGGFIETSSSHVKIADTARITTASALGLNGTWLIDPLDFTIAATGGDITGAALSTLLGSNSIQIETANSPTASATNLIGSTGNNGDIFVNDPVSWSANTTLTLNAFRNININSSITASGASGAVALLYGQGVGAASNTATYSFGLTSSGFAGQINLQAGNNFSTKLGSDGVVTNYTVITQLGSAGDETVNPGNSLQGLAATANLGGNYVLGANINASGTSSWNANAGFVPIGVFTGNFDGLGHTVSNLFSSGSGAALFGNNAGVISNVAVTGTINAGSSTAGGLVGYNSGSVINSMSSVTLTGGQYTNGGLVGENSNTGTILDSISSATITGNAIYTGGLVGVNRGTIAGSSFSGSVQGGLYTGGLVGYNGTVQSTTFSSTANIHGSSSSGAVYGSNNEIGGLVGRNCGTIDNNSYSTSTITASVVSEQIGGLAGSNWGTINNSHATADMPSLGSGNYYVGGLVGRNSNRTISGSYATGSVHGGTFVGGLVGKNGGGDYQ